MHYFRKCSLVSWIRGSLDCTYKQCYWWSYNLTEWVLYFLIQCSDQRKLDGFDGWSIHGLLILATWLWSIDWWSYMHYWWLVYLGSSLSSVNREWLQWTTWYWTVDFFCSIPSLDLKTSSSRLCFQMSFTGGLETQMPIAECPSLF